MIDLVEVAFLELPRVAALVEATMALVLWKVDQLWLEVLLSMVEAPPSAAQVANSAKRSPLAAKASA